MIYGALKFNVDNIVPQKALISSFLEGVKIEPGMSTFQYAASSLANKDYFHSKLQILEENGQHETDSCRSFLNLCSL